MYKFKVIGDYGLDSEMYLESFETLAEALRWFKGYTKRGLGGYENILVCSFYADGEMIEHDGKYKEH